MFFFFCFEYVFFFYRTKSVITGAVSTLLIYYTHKLHGTECSLFLVLLLFFERKQLASTTASNNKKSNIHSCAVWFECLLFFCLFFLFFIREQCEFEICYALYLCATKWICEQYLTAYHMDLHLVLSFSFFFSFRVVGFCVF